MDYGFFAKYNQQEISQISHSQDLNLRERSEKLSENENGLPKYNNKVISDFPCFFSLNDKTKQ